MSRLVSKEITWEAAHRLVHGYPGNCKNVHGHSYKATITVKLRDGYALDNYGFVLDFAEFKKVKKWVDENWDHAALVSPDDKEWLRWLKKHKQRHAVFGPRENPSAENIAYHLFRVAESLFNGDPRFRVVMVKVNETCTSEAIYAIP